MNKFFAIGNLTRDPELSETASNIPVCRFSIAVNRRFSSNDETDFFNITAWRQLAERVAKYVKKGNKIAVAGSIQIRNYEDNNGQKRTSVDVVAEEIEFLFQKQNNEARAQNETKKKPALEAFDDDSECPF